MSDFIAAADREILLSRALVGWLQLWSGLAAPQRLASRRRDKERSQ